MNIDKLNYLNKKKMNALYEKYGSNPVIKHLTHLQETLYKDDVAMWNQINHIERSLMESGTLSQSSKGSGGMEAVLFSYLPRAF